MPVPVSAPIPGPQNAMLQLATTPAGASFAIYSGVVASKTTPATPPLHSGCNTRISRRSAARPIHNFLHNHGWPDDRAEIAVQPGETLPVEYTFPHGSVTITSMPDGAEIFASGNSLGQNHAVDGRFALWEKQELVARLPDFPKKTEHCHD